MTEHLGQAVNPFDNYPGKGRDLADPFLRHTYRYQKMWENGSNSKHHYALYLILETKQPSCAYCEKILVDTFDHWLLTSIDHVVPKNAIKSNDMREDWVHDLSNVVICCLACNGYLNQYKLPTETRGPLSMEKWFALRDRTFREKREEAQARLKTEREFFDENLGSLPSSKKDL